MAQIYTLPNEIKLYEHSEESELEKCYDSSLATFL